MKTINFLSWKGSKGLAKITVFDGLSHVGLVSEEKVVRDGLKSNV
eukprot:CAMPEP_0201984292 /NCGR_PEP_ID=MMETSP0904-20121228/82939_1 /ASSEMBLY_ACC=CAM_ASM_000553 /TAXON_ID=420261 /ORGANISM="Thalassiosira antarctica, Strain CCMP982" /LENGTH=44 /DNA_ID= /DNA_START= /DNA_END= /DNA_ORIENTATION=